MAILKGFDEPQPITTTQNMKDGQIAVLLGGFEGILIQRVGKEFITLGKAYVYGYPIGIQIPCRILDNGELIKVINN